MREAGVWNCGWGGSPGKKLRVPQFAISGIPGDAEKIELDTSVQWLTHFGGGLWRPRGLTIPGVGMRSILVSRDGLIARGGLTVYVLSAALRAALSDA
jgi:hypothetical protein